MRSPFFFFRTPQRAGYLSLEFRPRCPPLSSSFFFWLLRSPRRSFVVISLSGGCKAYSKVLILPPHKGILFRVRSFFLSKTRFPFFGKWNGNSGKPSSFPFFYISPPLRPPDFFHLSEDLSSSPKSFLFSRILLLLISFEGGLGFSFRQKSLAPSKEMSLL